MAMTATDAQITSPGVQPCVTPGCGRRAIAQHRCKSCYYRHRCYGTIRSLLVDVAPVRQRVAQHLARGRSWHALARLAGVDQAVVKAITTSQRQRVRATTARNILAVALPPTAVGTVRRVRALRRIGYTLEGIAAATGIAESHLRKVLRSGAISERVAMAVAKAYKRLSGTPGPSRRAIRLAELAGYPAPLDWEEVDIDDPAAAPAKEGPSRPEHVDWVAVARAVTGQPVVGRRLSKGEAREVAAALLERGASTTLISKRTKRNGQRVRALLAESAA